jgi:hypothetical protein
MIMLSIQSPHHPPLFFSGKLLEIILAPNAPPPKAALLLPLV